MLTPSTCRNTALALREASALTAAAATVAAAIRKHETFIVAVSILVATTRGESVR